MPIYEYECRKCGVFEYSQSINDDALKRCPTCRSGVQKLLSAPAFHLKGGGWYSDGYEKKGEKKGDSPPGKAASAGDGKAAGGDSSDAKPAGDSGKSSKSAKSSKSKSSKGSKTAGA